MTAITIIWCWAAPRRAPLRAPYSEKTLPLIRHAARARELPPINADYLSFHDHIDQRKNARIGQMFRVFHRVFFPPATMLLVLLVLYFPPLILSTFSPFAVKIMRKSQDKSE